MDEALQYLRKNDVTVSDATEQLPLPTPLNPSAFSSGRAVRRILVNKSGPSGQVSELPTRR
jgi:hypothetical protein